ncbi:MAG: TetR/AcrR family transcriptional regulator [Bacteroidia bacterium]|nr:TetR/AcrR family transcriptional regulator [Bacteroidia bacterium]MDW8301831.1 TetR/AcrR family transcriptional regulator [Bacteroidia bacterium]
MNEETWKNILQQSLQLFSQFGIRNISMDDIAKSTGISKKTLYQYVKDKDELILKTFEYELQSAHQITNQIIEQYPNALETLIKITERQANRMKGINPVAVLELQKYHPNVWALMSKYNQEQIIPNVIKILKTGIEQGYFRKELNVQILARLHVEQIRIMFDPSIFSYTEYELSEVYYTIQDLFIRSIVTEKGLKYYEAHYSNLSKINRKNV